MRKKIASLIGFWVGFAIIPYVLGLHLRAELVRWHFGCELCSITSTLHDAGLWLIGFLAALLMSLLGLFVYTMSSEIWRNTK